MFAHCCPLTAVRYPRLPLGTISVRPAAARLRCDTRTHPEWLGQSTLDGSMGSIRKLRVADDAHQLAIEVYRVTENFPKPETYGLRAQMRAAAVSVPSNLAEGVGRNMDGELCRFAAVALGSAGELRCQMLIARDLGYLEATTADALDERIDKVSAMLAKLTRRVKGDIAAKRIADSG